MRRASAALVALAAAAGALAGCTEDHAAQGGGWKALQPSALERTEVAATRIGRFIYVVGGFERQSGATTNAVERYDIDRDSWSRVRGMPLAVNHTTATAHRGKLYVAGGYRGRRDLSSATAALQRYDPRRNRWSRLPSAPTARAAEAAGVIGGKLYLAGGANSSGSLRSLDVYDIAHRRWRRGPSFRGPARNHTTGAAIGRFFYVLAGRDQRNFRAVDRYDVRRHRWRRLPQMRTARGGIASAVVDGKIVVFGGERLEPGGTTIAEVELFNPRRRRWSRLPDMKTPRHGLGGAALGRRVYAIEGGPQPGFHFSRAIEALDLP